MVFSSMVFLFYFLPIVTVVYFIVPKKLKNIVLFIASLVFYAWGEPKYVVIMLFSSVFNYFSGLVIDKTRAKKAALTVNIIVNIGILVFFKYTNFICSWFGYGGFNIALPIGISFYTFQALSYTIDVYRKETSVQKNYISFGLYLSLFPQLIAGPIVRYDDVAKQLDNRTVTGKRFMLGFSRFCAGLCKKVLLANSIGKLWNLISASDPGSLSLAMAWLGVFAFGMQLYFDFSGYSDMAIGLGKMFGFDFLENFNYPFVSKSLTEFWRRWHMSLGTWFREYIYIPLGGNRKGRFRSNLNVLIVWILTGLWHGAAWNFVMWGLYFGIMLILEKQFLRKLLEKNKVIAFIYSTIFVSFSWVLFAVSGARNIFSYFGSLFNVTNLGITSREFLYNIKSYGVLAIIAIIAAIGIVKKLYDKYVPQKLYWVKYILACIGFIVCVAYLVDDTFNPFLYFRF
ncbi:MAG: MBOAT family protein [Clostridia bacterium]|nr:MBOAT family protein [Clostridia bacterium]